MRFKDLANFKGHAEIFHCLRSKVTKPGPGCLLRGSQAAGQARATNGNTNTDTLIPGGVSLGAGVICNCLNITVPGKYGRIMEILIWTH